MMLYSGNLNILKNMSNISNALSCKKSKTPKNKHSKYDKKGLGNIKPIKDYIYQHPTFSLSSSALSVVDKKRKKKKTHLKNLSQDSLSDITSKSFHRNLISPPESEIKVKPKELCKCLHVCLSRGTVTTRQPVLLEIIAVKILKLFHTVLMMGSQQIPKNRKGTQGNHCWPCIRSCHP